MGRLELVAPKQGHKIAVMGFREEFLKAKERISGGAGLEQADNYEDWLGHKYIPHYGWSMRLFSWPLTVLEISLAFPIYVWEQTASSKHMPGRSDTASVPHREEKAMPQKYSALRLNPPRNTAFKKYLSLVMSPTSHLPRS